jgi:hypothetical protein
LASAEHRLGESRQVAAKRLAGSVELCGIVVGSDLRRQG